MRETISAPSFLPPLLTHRVSLRCILLPPPKSHPHCQDCPWQGCASLCAKLHRNDRKESKPKAHVNDVQRYFHFLDTLKQLPMSPLLVALELHQTSRPFVCLTSSAYFHIPIPLSPTHPVCKPQPRFLFCPRNNPHSCSWEKESGLQPNLLVGYVCSLLTCCFFISFSIVGFL